MDDATPIRHVVTPVRLQQILAKINCGDEPRRLFGLLCDIALEIPDSTSVAILLRPHSGDSGFQLVASGGKWLHEIPFEPGELPQNTLTHGLINGIPLSQNMTLFEICSLGVGTGVLVLEHNQPLGENERLLCNMLGSAAGQTYARQRFETTLAHVNDRLEVLTDMNDLIAKNTPLTRMITTICRESCFRFSADTCQVFLTNDDQQSANFLGSAGRTHSDTPSRLQTDYGIVKTLLQRGGLVGQPIGSLDDNDPLCYFVSMGIASIEAAAMTVMGEPLGFMLLGFTHLHHFSTERQARFQEFCQAASVAIANAQIQNRIAQYAERLEELVEERTKELEVQTKLANEANQAKSRFLANMSHELRSPLTSMIGYSSIMSDGVFGPLSSKQKDALAAISRSSNHLKRLIDDVLNLSRIESGTEEATPELIDVAELLSHSVKLIQQQAVEKRIKITPYRKPPSDRQLTIHADSKHLGQIVINLLSNAVKYTPAGGKITLQVSATATTVTIHISDTGIGLSPKELKTLFTRFQRGEDSYAREQEGTGIGLNLTKQLTHLNHGDIQVESEEGKGSTFSITLPRGGELLTEVEKELPMTDVSLEGVRAVIVEDNEDTARVLFEMMHSLGGECLVAHTTQDGLDFLDILDPHIIITDLSLPEKDGISLVETIKNPTHPYHTTPIIVLSAFAFQKDKDAALEAGASLFIPKPFLPSEVARAIAALLDLSTEEQGDEENTRC